MKKNFQFSIFGFDRLTIPRHSRDNFQNTPSHSKRGFTFLEFMFIVSLVGILSSIVFLSLNQAKIKASHTKVKSQLSELRGAAEVYFDNNEGYDLSASDTCSSPFFTDDASGMIDYTNPANYPLGSVLTCHSNDIAYAVSAILPGEEGTKSWCVDSTGASALINAPVNSTACFSGQAYAYQSPSSYGYQTPSSYSYQYPAPYAYEYQYQYQYQYQTPVAYPYQYQSPNYLTPIICLYNEGSVISGGDEVPGQGASKAFEDITPSTLMSLYDNPDDGITKTVYIGRHFDRNASVRTISAYRTGIYSFSGPIQYSDDGNNWLNTGESFNIPAGNSGWTTITLPVDIRGHRYWRILDNQGDAYHQIDELSFYSCA